MRHGGRGARQLCKVGRQIPAGERASTRPLSSLASNVSCCSLPSTPPSQVGSYEGQGNKNIEIGDYFNINLREPPYSLGNPRAFYNEETPDDTRKKFLLLFELAKLRGLDYAAMARQC